jgi:hypothetical protein
VFDDAYMRYRRGCVRLPAGVAVVPPDDGFVPNPEHRGRNRPATALGLAA